MNYIYHVGFHFVYDMAAQRRHVIAFYFHKTLVKEVTKDPDGNTPNIGNGYGDLASVNICTGTQFSKHLIKYVS